MERKRPTDQNYSYEFPAENQMKTGYDRSMWQSESLSYSNYTGYDGSGPGTSTQSYSQLSAENNKEEPMDLSANDEFQELQNVSTTAYASSTARCPPVSLSGRMEDVTESAHQAFLYVDNGRSPVDLLGPSKFQQSDKQSSDEDKDSDDASSYSQDNEYSMAEAAEGGYDGDIVENYHKEVKIVDVPVNKTRIKRKGANELPIDLKNLLGEATLQFSYGNMERSKEICKSIIREAPYSPEPYQTLATIYMDDAQLALTFRLLAAHVQYRLPSEEWLALADECLALKLVEKAANCFRQGVMSNQTDVNMIERAAAFHLERNQFSAAMNYYHKKVAAIPKTHGRQAKEFALKHAKECHKRGEPDLAIGFMRKVLQNHPQHFSDGDLNMLCEVMLENGKYLMTLECLYEKNKIEMTFAKPVVDYDDEDEEDLQSEDAKKAKLDEEEEECKNGNEKKKEKVDFVRLIDISIFEDTHVDLKCKAVYATIMVGRSQYVKDDVREMMQLDSNSFGELQYEIALAYYNRKHWSEANDILAQLLQCDKYERAAAMLLKRAECLSEMGKHEESIPHLLTCVQLAPGCVDARIALAISFTETGRHQSAIDTLVEVADGYEITKTEKTRILYQQYLSYDHWGAKDNTKYALAADTLLILFANKLRPAFINFSRLGIMKRTRKSRNPLAGQIKLIYYRISQKHGQTDNNHFMDADEFYFSKPEWYNLFRQVLKLLNFCSRYKEAVILNQEVISDRQLLQKISREKLELVGVRLSLLSGWYTYAYDYIRNWLLRYEKPPPYMWNIFNQVVSRTDDLRHHRFCVRYSQRKNNLALIILKAHGGISAGKYRFALNGYLRVLEMFPKDSLAQLMIGIIYIHIMSQKTTGRRHAFVTQGMAFLINYAKTRGCGHESYYNIGRALQQIGLKSFALTMYKRALATAPPVVNENVEDNKLFDLSGEIAYNMSLIYRKSGNHEKANSLLMRYCVV